MRFIWISFLGGLFGWGLTMLGVSLGPSVGIVVTILLVAWRRQLSELLWPKRFYRMNCLSIRGLESRPPFERDFRRALADILCRSFTHDKPTACCCVKPAAHGFEGVLILHRTGGHSLVRSVGDSEIGAAEALLSELSSSVKRLTFVLPTHDLTSHCRACPTRKAHRLASRNFTYLNPLNYPSRWAHFISWIRS